LRVIGRANKAATRDGDVRDSSGKLSLFFYFVGYDCLRREGGGERRRDKKEGVY